MNFFLAITSDHYDDPIIKTEGFLETLGFGGMILLIGMLTVIAVLVLIWGALIIFERVFHKDNAKKVKKTTPSPVVTVQSAPTSHDDEIIAAIAAAITMAESESGGAKFRVVSFKRK